MNPPTAHNAGSMSPPGGIMYNSPHMDELNGENVLAFADAAQWESWLEDHHDRTTGVWLRIAKKGSGRASVTLAEALDVALCYGWIDSHRKGLDEDHYLQRYSPRRPNSSWSQVNVDKVEALIAAGRMRAPGLAAIEAAKADGRWDAAYEAQRTATVPPDLAAALAQNERARERFEALDRTQRYALFLRLMKAKTPANRAVQLERMIESLSA
jgi:uncharacterized protein YdeI (YjbR/CyaY-like superfamily)